MLGFLTEVERVDRLLVIRKRLRHRANDRSLGIPTKRCLQNACHLTIAVVYEHFTARVALGQLINHV